MAKVQIFSLMLLAAACCLMMAPANAMYHIVGGSLGWSMPKSKTYFEEWAKPRVFGVEDKLLFPFSLGANNVMEVGADDFENCTRKTLINSYVMGPLIINFTAPGDHYYYSGKGLQCEAGLKLHVTVVPGKGSTGRIHQSARDGISAGPAPAPAPAPASNSATASSLIGGWKAVTGVVGFVAWLVM